MIQIPKASQTNKRASRKRGKAAVLTCSPYKQVLVVDAKNDKTKKSVKKWVAFEETTSRYRHERFAPPPPSSSQNDDLIEKNEYLCRDYLEKGCIKYSSCSKWAHNSCAGVEEHDEEVVHCSMFGENKLILDQAIENSYIYYIFIRKLMEGKKLQ